MTEKRFTMCHEQNDINGWTMSIVDWQTKQPFDYTTYEVHSSSITATKDEMEDLCLLLNELHDENIRLRRALQIELDKDLPSAPVGHCRCTTEPHRCDEND